MYIDIKNLHQRFPAGKEEYTPDFFRIQEGKDKIQFEALINSGRVHLVHDDIYDQLQDLIKSRNPSRRLTDTEYKELIAQHLNGAEESEYGVWVFFPWSGRLVHLLDEAEFIEVRTNRNKYKINQEEQDTLSTKKVGIIGLSVGNSAALALAMERGCGEIRLADFDRLDLSNLNRIRTGIQHLGTLKTVIAAREIAEIDPFLKVTLYSDGVTDDNLNDYFTKDGRLDLLIEECDSLDVKISSRYKARQLKVPVVMDTSDRGLIDVERFDLEPDRPLLHGLAGDIHPEMIKNLTNEEKIPFVMKIVNFDAFSPRMKMSMGEVGKTLNTWPQLASGVLMGGAITADVSRRILLGNYCPSGRYYVDPEQIISDIGTGTN